MAKPQFGTWTKKYNSCASARPEWAAEIPVCEIVRFFLRLYLVIEHEFEINVPKNAEERGTHHAHGVCALFVFV